MSSLSSYNKLSLRQFVKTQHNQQQHTTQLSQHIDRRYSIKQGRKMKLNTLPCEQINRQKQQSRQQFMFRSTWQGDMQNLKQEIKGCTSPTFATQCLSLAYNNKENGYTVSGLFHAVGDQHSQHLQQQQSSQMRRSTNNSKQVSNSKSRSKSKCKNKSSSMQKFIGDSVAKMYRNTITMKNTENNHPQQTQPHSQVNTNISVLVADESQKMMYEVQRLQAKNQQLIRQKKRFEDKYIQIKQTNIRLEQELLLAQNKMTHSSQSPLMTNEQLLQRMRLQSFWKFYLRAQKMIKSSLQQNNPSSSVNSAHSVINFMKELQALRQISSEMKKQNKSMKKLNQERLQELQQCKDRLSVQQASIEQHRLKCVAYESTIKKLREELSISNSKKELTTRLQQINNQLQQKLSAKTAQCTSIAKQLVSVTQQVQQQQMINSQCQRQRVSIKKKAQQLSQQITSLNKQLSSLKTSYNLLQIEKQQLSANKKQLIEKQKLKQRVYQLEKELKSISLNKEQQLNKLKTDYDRAYTQEMELKDSKCKEMDQKVNKIMDGWRELQQKNIKTQNENQLLLNKLTLLTQQNTNLNKQLSAIANQHTTSKQQQHQKLSQLSKQLSSLNIQLQQQSLSLLTQEKMIKQLREQINEKENMLKEKQFESQRLRQSLCEVESHNNNHNFNQKNKDDLQVRFKQLQDYVSKLQSKHNEALEMYQNIHNEKIQLQMQLQCYQQQVGRCQTQIHKYQQLVSTLQQQISQKHQKHQGESLLQDIHSNNNNNIHHILQIIQSILSIKEQIIRKILIFCPLQFRQLFVEYIYCGDVIKEKYLKIIENINVKDENQNNNGNITGCGGNYYDGYTQQTQQDEQMIGEQQYQAQQYVQQQRRQQYQRQSDMINTSGNSNPTSIRTLPNTKLHSTNYQPQRQSCYHHDERQLQRQEQQDQEQDNEISILMEQFMRIGNIIQEETNSNNSINMNNINSNSNNINSNSHINQNISIKRPFPININPNNCNYLQSYSNNNNKPKHAHSNFMNNNKTQYQLIQQQAPRSQQSFLRQTNLKQQTAINKQPPYGQQNTININNMRPNLIKTKQNNTNQQNYLLKKNYTHDYKFQPNYINKAEGKNKYNPYSQQYTISRPLFSHNKSINSSVNNNNNRNNFNNGLKSDK